MKVFNKILAVTFLAALLFAISGKTIHVLYETGHDHDFVCSENATHFHEQEHTCFICEFEFQVVDGFECNNAELVFNAQIKEELSNTIFFVLSETHFQFKSRGPPTV